MHQDETKKDFSFDIKDTSFHNLIRTLKTYIDIDIIVDEISQALFAPPSVPLKSQADYFQICTINAKNRAHYSPLYILQSSAARLDARFTRPETDVRSGTYNLPHSIHR